MTYTAFKDTMVLILSVLAVFLSWHSTGNVLWAMPVLLSLGLLWARTILHESKVSLETTPLTAIRSTSPVYIRKKLEDTVIDVQARTVPAAVEQQRVARKTLPVLTHK